MSRDSIIMIIGAAAAVILQLVVAPNIAIFSVMPNFLLAYSLVLAIVRPMNNSTLIVAFVFGLLFDLMGHGPVGAMAFLMVLAAFCASRLFMVMNNSAFAMAAITLFVSFLLVETIYALFLLMFGFSAGPIDAFLYRALPCTLYDCVFGFIFYPIALRLFVETPRSSSSDAPHASLGPSGSVSQLPKRRKKKPRF
ncbi:MAG: rod shape-determining protein MreD [Raoultibacter sp.]